MAGKQEETFYELVTGRISLEKNKSIGAELKEACKVEGAKYQEAADCLLVTGTLAQLRKVKRRITGNGMSRSERSGSSSSDRSEKLASPSFQEHFETQPYLATYIQAFYNEDLKKIEQCYNVVMKWVSDGGKVQITASSASATEHHFKLACDEFIKFYQSLYKSVSHVPFDVKMQIEGFTKESLEMIVCSVSQYVPGLIILKEADGRTYNLCGTHTSLANGQEWIRKQLGILSSSPKSRSLSPRAVQNALTHETPNQLKVVVYEGDITQENSDIIVNACNKHLDHGGGVSFAIAKAGGPLIQLESDQYIKQHGALSTGDVAVTGSGFLKCKQILHAVGPQWKRHKKDGSITFLQKIFWEIYHIALNVKAKSVAIPAISSGIFGVPKEVCAQTMFSFIDDLDQNLALKKTGPFEIRLVNIDPETVTVFRQEFRTWLLKGKKIERRHSLKGRKKDPEKQPASRKSADDMHMLPLIKNSLLQLKGGLVHDKVKMSTANTSPRTSTTGSTTVPTSASPQQPPSPSLSSGQQDNPAITTSTAYGQTQQGMKSRNGQHVNGGPRAFANPATTSSLSTRNMPVHNGQNSKDSQTTQGKTSNDDCPICQSAITNPKVLPRCGHTFCTQCINKAFTYQKKCPICQEVYGITEGNQPDGTMKVDRSYHSSLPGYEGCGYYTITYDILSGKQDSRHPNPGSWFTGTTRHAYLPASKEGQVVLKLLQKAFEKKLIFTVGRSTTTGREDCVTWNDIHHKTRISGGPQRFGYPDPDYLGRVTEELKAKGIVPE